MRVLSVRNREKRTAVSNKYTAVGCFASRLLQQCAVVVVYILLYHHRHAGVSLECRHGPRKHVFAAVELHPIACARVIFHGCGLACLYDALRFAVRCTILTNVWSAGICSLLSSFGCRIRAADPVRFF